MIFRDSNGFNVSDGTHRSRRRRVRIRLAADRDAVAGARRHVREAHVRVQSRRRRRRNDRLRPRRRHRAATRQHRARRTGSSCRPRVRSWSGCRSAATSSTPATPTNTAGHDLLNLRVGWSFARQLEHDAAPEQRHRSRLRRSRRLRLRQLPVLPGTRPHAVRRSPLQQQVGVRLKPDPQAALRRSGSSQPSMWVRLQPDTAQIVPLTIGLKAIRPSSAAPVPSALPNVVLN